MAWRIYMANSQVLLLQSADSLSRFAKHDKIAIMGFELDQNSSPHDTNMVSHFDLTHTHTQSA